MATKSADSKPVATWAKELDFAGLEKQNGLPPGLLSAICTIESGGDPKADSGKAKGLFQFKAETATAMGVDPTSPSSSAAGAARYLKSAYKTYGRWDRAVASYNCGAGNLDKIISGKMEPIPETTTYVERAIAAGATKVAADREKGDAKGQGTFGAAGVLSLIHI